MRQMYLHALWLIAALVLGGCSDRNENSEGGHSTIHVGILPDESSEQLVARLDPLFEYLAEHTGLVFEFVIPDSYEQLVTDFGSGKVDLAYFGAYTFLNSHREYGAVPLVMRDVDLRFTSVFLVRSDEPAQSLADLEGRSISFGSSLSTSGHLMPRYFMEDQGIVPEQFFGEIQYSGAHDATAYAVLEGRADVGAINASIVRKMLSSGLLDSRSVRILWETPPYADYVWAIRSGIDEDLRIRLRDAFLSIDLNNPGHAAILDGIQAGGFVPASMRDFSRLQGIVDQSSAGASAD